MTLSELRLYSAKSWKDVEVVVVWLNVLSADLSRGTEKNHEKRISGRCYVSAFRLRTFQIWSRNDRHSATEFGLNRVEPVIVIDVDTSNCVQQCVCISVICNCIIAPSDCILVVFHALISAKDTLRACSCLCVAHIFHQQCS